MYQPYDPFVYQPYNDPQPEHYASAVPQGMPQPARPNAFASTEPPYASYQDQYPSYKTSSTYESQPYQHYGSQPSYYPVNPTPQDDQYTPPYAHSAPLAHSASNHYPPLGPQSTSSLSHSNSQQYPPQAPTDSNYYPSVSSAPYTSAPVETSWNSYTSKLDTEKHDERHGFHSVPKRDDKKENVSFSVDEAQAIIKQLKEKNKSLDLQLKNSRESINTVVSEKDAKIEQLQKEIDAARSQISRHTPAVDPQEAVAVVEREWMQRCSSKEQEYQGLLARAQSDVDSITHKLSSKEQENQELLARAQKDAEAIAQLERDWAEKLSNVEQENSALLARVTKHQSDTDSGRAFLLETNAAQEAELIKLREEAKQGEAELMKLKDETDKQEQELMKLRDETNQLLDEITQMVEDKDNALLSVKKLEEEKRDLEEKLAGSDVVAEEKEALSRTIATLEQELEECRDLCEDRRQRIESLENEEMPTLNSQLDLMTSLDEKARDTIAKLEDKLEECIRARDALEHKLFEADQREMENELRLAGESRSATEEIQRLRFELDNHMAGKSDHQKWLLELESEKRTLEQKLAHVEGEKREALDRIPALEESLKDLTEKKDTLEDDLACAQETMDREAQENLDAQTDFRSKIEKLEKEVSTLTHDKNEAERLLHATEEMLKLLNEEFQQKLELDTTAKGGEEQTLVEGKLADFENKNAQLLEQISEMREQASALEEEKEQLVELLEDAKNELIAKKRMEREIKGLRIELNKEVSTIERLEAEIESLKSEIVELKLASQDATDKILDLEENRTELERQFAAFQDDKKWASVKASELGEEICKLETENKEWFSRFNEVNAKYCDIVAERDELQQTNRMLRNK